MYNDLITSAINVDVSKRTERASLPEVIGLASCL
jgi:hypothetical protein